MFLISSTTHWWSTGWFHNQFHIRYLLSPSNSGHHTGGAVFTRKHFAEGAGFMCKSVPPFILSGCTSLRRLPSLVASSSVRKAVHSQTDRRGRWVIPRFVFPPRLDSLEVLQKRSKHGCRDFRGGKKNNIYLCVVLSLLYFLVGAEVCVVTWRPVILL